MVIILLENHNIYTILLSDHKNLQPQYLGAEENTSKQKITLISLESCSCDFIEIHGKLSKCIYVDVTSTLAIIQIS